MTSAKEIPYENKEEKLIYRVEFNFDDKLSKEESIEILKNVEWTWANDLVKILEGK